MASVLPNLEVNLIMNNILLINTGEKAVVCPSNYMLGCLDFSTLTVLGIPLPLGQFYKHK